MLVHACNLALGKLSHEAQKFKIILGYTWCLTSMGYMGMLSSWQAALAPPWIDSSICYLTPNRSL